MVKKDILKAIEELVIPLVEKHKFELVEVEFVKEGADWFLRIYIDKPEGISIDDCQIISQEINPILDKMDIIKQSYVLEVSSPGLERPLKTERDFEKYKGEEVEVKLFKPIDGIKIFTGVLNGLIDSQISITVDKGMEQKFQREQVALVKRVIKF
jgi:ribosome maturation factor RimP